MTPSIRLLALLTLIVLSVWLGFLLGAGLGTEKHEQVAEEQATTDSLVSSPDRPTGTDSSAQAPPTAYERAQDLVVRINDLAKQTDDRVIARQRAALLDDLSREMTGPDANTFATAVHYYNSTIPRDGAGLLLESSYYQRLGRLREAIDPLIAAAEFPESNEQLTVIENVQAELLSALFNEHAALEDWQSLTHFFETLLVRAPNNDRIRLLLADAQARSGDIDSALGTLEITGTEAGVSQQEIDELEDSLLRSEVAPIQFRSEGNSLVASATLNAAPIELLVDTGATKTALATAVLRELGAYPLNETAQVMTAAGRITAQLYQIPELIVEQTLFRNSIVLALDNPPASWDGLLGMDLLRDMNVDLSNQLAP